MPRYRTDGSGKIFKKRFKPLDHKKAVAVHAKLSKPQFRQLQELALHGMGYPTDYSQSLPEFHKKKVKPSAFKQYADAHSTKDLIKALVSEKTQHDNPISETHFGGGLLDAFNAVGTWAYNLLGNDTVTPPTDLNWTYTDLDANNIPDQMQAPVDDIFTQALDTPLPDLQPQGNDTQDNLVDLAIATAGGYAASYAQEAVADVATGLAESASTWITDILVGAMFI